MGQVHVSQNKRRKEKGWCGIVYRMVEVPNIQTAANK